ncbi:hypothetical protein A3H19_03365 [Candidatus Woesebacteria bacterium RIFCSPLOWO2_12_FULL_39_9]|nr:MAG: hypothetical protein A3H19_03365 [Candidatus Woesebacteria bacterium RIFCSPLOWO2_12_FULL_39_9]
MKPLIITIGVTILLIFGFIFLKGKDNTQVESSQDSQILGDAVGIEVNPGNYDLGNVPINGGLVTKEYEIKNTTDKTLIIKKITTSCMCTKASFEIGGEATKFFGMEGHGDKNPSVNVEIGAGATGKTIVRFDPAAHGPQGAGPVDRSVFLTFSDPAGIKELKFNGVVVK